jgi:hypothetical protein
MMDYQQQTPVKNDSTRRRVIGRFFSAVMVSLAIALLLQQSDIRDIAMGKVAFLASQADFYDRLLVRLNNFDIIVGSILICILFIAYELLAYIIYKIIPQSSIE